MLWPRDSNRKKLLYFSKIKTMGRVCGGVLNVEWDLLEPLPLKELSNTKMTVVLIHIPTFLNSSRCFPFRISLPASHQSSKNMRTTPRTQTLFLFGEGSGRSLHTSRVGFGYLASVSACRPRAQRDEHLLSPGSQEPRQRRASGPSPRRSE